MDEQNQMNQGGATSAGVGATGATGGAKFESSKTHVRQAAEDFKTAATDIAGQYRGKAEEAWGQAQDRVRTFQEDGEAYVRENPTKAVFTALGIGFVLGIIFRR